MQSLKQLRKQQTIRLQDNAKGIIFNVTGGEQALKLNEVNTAIGLVNNRVDANADVIFGTVVDVEEQE